MLSPSVGFSTLLVGLDIKYKPKQAKSLIKMPRANCIRSANQSGSTIPNYTSGSH